MQHFCTFETAQRLADAGFPQPEPQGGQFWYETETKNIFTPLVMRRKKQHSGFVGLAFCEWRSDADGLIFAPGIADLLQALGPGWALQKGEGGSWRAYSWEHEFIDTEPAQALAGAWLFINEDNPADRDEF